MKKTILLSAAILFLVGLSPSASAQKTKQGSKTAAKTDLKFLDDIAIDVPVSQENTAELLPTANKTEEATPQFAVKKTSPGNSASSVFVETAVNLQFKYSVILNTEVEQITNLNLFRLVDEWFGAPYKLGGTSKLGIDCSALMQVFFSTLYGITLPRTAREQYEMCRKISRAALKEGDLVFFNTVGKISHVGMYLQNNKFVHASSSGVTISDLSDPYWSRRFKAVGRLDALNTKASNNDSSLQP